MTDKQEAPERVCECGLPVPLHWFDEDRSSGCVAAKLRTLLAEKDAEIERLTKWQDLAFEMLSEVRQWTAPGSITDLQAPDVLRAMLRERAELRANHATELQQARRGVWREAIETLKTYARQQSQKGEDWYRQIEKATDQGTQNQYRSERDHCVSKACAADMLVVIFEAAAEKEGQHAE